MPSYRVKPLRVVTTGFYHADEHAIQINTNLATLNTLNLTILHETKHAVNHSLGITKSKSAIQEALELSTYYLGIYSLALISFSQLRIYNTGLFFAITPPIILSFISLWGAKKAKYRFSKNERLARKFEKKMIQDPRFNSMVTIK